MLNICFYILTNDCKNDFKGGLLVLALKLHPLYLLGTSASVVHSIGHFGNGK